MKKLLASLSIVLLAISFAACQWNEPEKPIEPPSTEYIFSLNVENTTFSEKGETMILFSDATRLPDVTWSVDKEGVVQIENGSIMAIDKGTVVITAAWKGQTAQCTVVCDIQPIVTEPPATEPPATKPTVVDNGSPVLQPPTTETVGASFFDDAVFVGDSVLLKLSYYASSSGRLGNAKFLVQGSYSARNAVSNKLQMSYQGKKLDLASAVAATGAKKLFIMLGMNDIAIVGVDKTIQNWRTMLGSIFEKCPDIEVYIQSMTPIWTGGEVGGLNNKRADQFNKALEAFTRENGYTYIDVASYMKDKTGGLASKYCSDNYVHITTAGASAWVSVLRAFEGY